MLISPLIVEELNQLFHSLEILAMTGFKSLSSLSMSAMDLVLAGELALALALAGEVALAPLPLPDPL